MEKMRELYNQAQAEKIAETLAFEDAKRTAPEKTYFELDGVPFTGKTILTIVHEAIQSRGRLKRFFDPQGVREHLSMKGKCILPAGFPEEKIAKFQEGFNELVQYGYLKQKHGLGIIGPTTCGFWGPVSVGYALSKRGKAVLKNSN